MHCWHQAQVSYSLPFFLHKLNTWTTTPRNRTTWESYVTPRLQRQSPSAGEVSQCGDAEAVHPGFPRLPTSLASATTSAKPTLVALQVQIRGTSRCFDSHGQPMDIQPALFRPLILTFSTYLYRLLLLQLRCTVIRQNSSPLGVVSGFAGLPGTINASLGPDLMAASTSLN